MTVQITLRKGYFLPLRCRSPPHLGIEVLWGMGPGERAGPAQQEGSPNHTELQCPPPTTHDLLASVPDVQTAGRPGLF